MTRVGLTPAEARIRFAAGMAKRATPKTPTAKPKGPALKVYVTPIGFHDAYVAAPSQAAALRAWGASADLFQRGVAAVVSDPKLTRAPLAAPGEVVTVPRGTRAQHLRAAAKKT